MEEKNISFGYGIHRSPTLGHDGELLECVNLVPKNQELVNIQPPHYTNIELGPEDELITIHETSEYKHYIVKSGGEHGSRISIGYFTDDDKERKQIALEDSITYITPSGNILNANTNDGLVYYAWKNDSYIVLRNVPDIDIQFALNGEYKTMSSVNQVKVIKGDNEASEGLYNIPFDTVLTSMTDWVTCNKMLKGVTYMMNRKGSTHKWYLWGKDNSGNRHLLMDGMRGLTNYFVEMPEDIVALSLSYEEFARPRAQTICIFSKSEASDVYNIENTAENYDAIMSRVEEFINYYQNSESKFVMPFFIRYAIKLFDGSYTKQSAPVLMLPNWGAVPVAYIPEKVYEDGEKYYSLTVGAMVCDLVYNIKNDISNLDRWKDVIQGVDIFVSSPLYKINEGKEFDEHKRNFRLLPYNRNSIEGITCHAGMERREGYSNPRTIELFDLIELDKATPSDPDIKSGMKFIDLPKFTDAEYIKKISETSHYYNIKSIDFDTLTSTVYNPESRPTHKIEIDAAGMNALETMPTLADDYNSHDKLYANTMFMYNKRLNIANIREDLYQGFPVALMHGYEGEYGQEDVYYAEISINYGGASRKVLKKYDYTNTADIRWFYYPNINATQVRIYALKDGAVQSVSTIPLTKHKFLNGAYAFSLNGMLDGGGSAEQVYDLTASISKENTIYTSNANNPFYFSLNGVNDIGSGSIIGVSAASKALSNGDQFGSSPLVVFATDGVWPLMVADDGTYAARKALSRDVCNNPNAILQIDNAVVFTTNKGLMLVDGSESTGVLLLSSSMEHKNIDESFLLEEFEKYISLDDYCPLIVKDTDMFVEMLSTCSMLFDSVNRLIHIYPKLQNGKHYVYSLTDREFSSYVGSDSYIKALVPGYPLSTIQLQDGNLVQYDSLNEEDVLRKGLLLTRPISFGEPMYMKMIADIRLSYSKNNVDSKCKYAMWASNDRYSWVRLKSLHAHSYKWYRFAIVTNLSDNDALEGMLLHTEIRRANKMR